MNSEGLFKSGARGKMSKDAIDRHVGSRLRQLRESRGLSREKLAAAMDMPVDVLEELEEGRSRLTAALIRPLCQILRVSPFEFFEGFSVTAQGRVRLGEDDAIAAEEEERLIRDFGLIRDPEARQLILALVSSYALFSGISRG